MALWRRFGFWAAADAPRTGFSNIACETAPVTSLPAVSSKIYIRRLLHGRDAVFSSLSVTDNFYQWRRLRDPALLADVCNEVDKVLKARGSIP